MVAKQEEPPSKNQKKDTPDNKENLQKSIAVARNVYSAQKTAEGLKDKAKNAVNPKERIKLLEEAYHKEVEAHGQSKYAKRLQSGPWQGATAGGGIGAGVAVGAGAVVGTLVTGLVSLPTVLVGGLTGAGVGGVHGPFIKFGGGDGDNKEEKPMTEEQIHAEAVKEAETLDQAVDKSASTVPQPPTLDEAEVAQADEVEARPPGPSRQQSTVSDLEGSVETPRRKPRKLEVRSHTGVSPSPTPEKRKPRKLQVKSVTEEKEGI